MFNIYINGSFILNITLLSIKISKKSKNKAKLKNKIRFQTMFRFLLILIIGQSMANSMKFSEYVDNGRIERVESAIYELLNIII